MYFNKHFYYIYYYDNYNLVLSKKYLHGNFFFLSSFYFLFFMYFGFSICSGNNFYGKLERFALCFYFIFFDLFIYLIRICLVNSIQKQINKEILIFRESNHHDPDSETSNLLI